MVETAVQNIKMTKMQHKIIIIKKAVNRKKTKNNDDFSWITKMFVFLFFRELLERK